MEYKEALEYLEVMRKFFTNDDDEGKVFKQTYDVAIEALEKQIPKKTDYDKDGTPRCAICMWDEFYNKEAMRYCPSCGQAIKWEETE